MMRKIWRRRLTFSVTSSILFYIYKRVVPATTENMPDLQFDPSQASREASALERMLPVS